MEVVGLFDVFAFGVAGGVDEAVHVDVEVVDVGVGGVQGGGGELFGVAEDFGVSHAHPFEEDRHSHIILLSDRHVELAVIGNDEWLGRSDELFLNVVIISGRLDEARNR